MMVVFCEFFYCGLVVDREFAGEGINYLCWHDLIFCSDKVLLLDLFKSIDALCRVKGSSERREVMFVGPATVV